MPLASNLQSQEYKFRFIVLEGTWYWTTRVDVSATAPQYSIGDIRSPFGLLRDSIAIPGDVAQAMADSITELKAAFPPSILLDQASMTFTMDEGRGASDAQDLQVTNGGVYGSVMSTSLTTSAAYITVRPPTIGGLSFNESGVAQVSANSLTLLAASSPYAATVIVQDATAANNPQVLSLAVVVRPKAHIALSAAGMEFVVTSPLTGVFPPIPSQAFTITNDAATASSLTYQVVKLRNASAWLVSYSPISGTLAGGASQSVLLNVLPAIGTAPGVYEEIMRVSGYSDNSYVDFTVLLTVL